MYEVGVAMACRQPIEVVLIRDDSEQLLFDVTSIPVVRYDVSDTPNSIKRIRETLTDRLKERALVKDMRLIATIESLSQFELNLIVSNRARPVLAWTGSSLPAAVAMALPRLLDKKVLRLQAPAMEDRPASYIWTTFGRALADAIPNNTSASA
jgi:hypothetical protein